MPYSDFLQQYQKKPTPPWPTMPVQVTPTIVCLFLSNRPSDFIILKSEQGTFILQVVDLAKDKENVKLKIHNKK